MGAKEQNKLTNKANRLIDTENILTVAKWWGVGVMGAKGKGLGSTKWRLRNSHRDVKHSVGNVVDNIVVTTYGARWN